MSHNTWIHRIARVTIVKPLVGTGIKPNQLTTARLVTGLGAAACFAIGTAPFPAIGAAIFVVSMVLDRADGDYARLTGQTSPQGHRYDLIADSLSNAVAFVGLGLGLRESGLGYWSIPLGILAGAAVAAVLWAVMRIENAEGARAAELGGFAGFDPDDAMLAVPVAIWLGWSEGLLIAAAGGATFFSLVFLFTFRKRMATGAD